MPVTRFPTRAEGVSDRMGGFMAHLRENGLAVGVKETGTALEALASIQATDWEECHLALKAVCAGDADQFARFDDLFKAYWFNRGRERGDVQTVTPDSGVKNRWSNRSSLMEAFHSSASGEQNEPSDEGEDDAAQSGDGRLIASKTRNIERVDLREFMKPDDLARAQRVAERLARSIRDRRSRRRRAARRGTSLDLRRMARKSVATGGEPLTLLKRQRPDRPVHLVALLDVSGSMTVYARVFLAFLKGLMAADQRTDAYLFHTRLVRISDALRDKDTLRAVNRLTMMVEGFGGGTKIGGNLRRFNAHYANRTVNSRSVVVILSDGYDTDPPETIAKELARLRKRGCKILWLNPLKGWKDYQPVARGMAAALPHLDLFAPATTLADLAALEPHLAKV